MRLERLRHHYFNTIPTLFILSGIILLTLAYGPLIKDEIWYQLKQLKNQQYILGGKDAQKDSVFARFISSSPVSIEPVNKEFSIIIEKIGINAPIVADVSITDPNAYNE